ncbi:MAG: glycogen synthase [Candidatus Caldatribacteriaceae bacterium]
MEIILVSSEAYPYAKSGGMGDVVGALWKYLPRFGVKVKLFLPGYPQVIVNHSFSREKDLVIPFGGGETKVQFLEFREESRSFIVVANDHFFRREKLYDYSDDPERFIFFSQAVFEYLVRWQESDFVLHCNDWESALLCAYIDRYWPAYRPRPGKVVFTIHNLAYQGIARGELFRLVNLPGQFFTHEYLEFYGNINLMKAGILFSHIITTVSPTYAREICSPEFGEGLDGLMRAITKKKKVVGIVNGIDTEVYNPATDSLIVQNYDSENLNGKKENKKAFLKRFFSYFSGEISQPLLVFVSRLVQQKGVDLFLENMEEFLALPAFFFFLGTGENRYEKLLSEAAKNHPNLRVELRFDENLAHFAYAAGDILLLPSLFEPCGISQMIAMRYGTLPIVRRVGGLLDTVIDYPFNPRLSNGFHFERFSSTELLQTIRRSLDIYANHEALWKRMMINAMESDFSWEKSVKDYLKVYQESF